MLAKLFKQLIKRKIVVVIILVLIVAGSYFGYQRFTKNDGATRYLTAVVERGTLIVSLSGSGQVSASEQIDIKPKVSGELNAFYIAKDQEIRTGQLLAVIDDNDAQRAVDEAEISLENAKIELEKLLSPPDIQELLQAENALAQAERDFEIAKRDYNNIDKDTELILTNAYEDGYNDVSTSFFKLSDYIEDLKDVLGTEQQTEEYIGSYELILGRNSSLIQRFLNDYNEAEDLYNETFSFFSNVYRNNDRDEIYELINDTLEATKAISYALESARHMYDAIVIRSYHNYYVSSVIDNMQPKIESDLSSIFSLITSLQNTIDIIDETVENMPDKIKDAELALKTAEEKLLGKEIALEELKKGADSLDIRTQQNILAQREASLAKVKEELANHYIYSPFNGIVADVNSSLRKGDNISSGSVLATIITNQRIAEITLNEIDIAQVKTGQKANITFDAVENLNVTGEIAEVDTLGSANQGVVTYGVKISFDTQDERIKPGMTLSTNIIINAKQNVLMVQSSAIKQQGDTSYVQAVDNIGINQTIANISGSVIPDSSLYNQEIQIGLSNNTMTEILNGLKEGDVVVAQSINSNSASNQLQRNTGGFNSGMMRMMR